MTSSINPNNINGNFPVAGVPNNTQGFRDNFTNTKTNFEYAQTEINDLQSKAVLKQALTGTTLDNNMGDNLLYAVKLQDVSYTYVQNTATSGSINIDYSAGEYQSIAPTGNISLSFSNWPASGSFGQVTIDVTVTNTAYTMTLPAAVTQGLSGLAGYSGGVITFYATGTYKYAFSTVDGGTNIDIIDYDRPRNIFFSTVNIANTTPSTSTTTGALIVAGGAGIGANLNVGGNISTAGIVTVTGNVVTSAGNVLITGGLGGVGYTAGAGGTVPQSGNKSGGVTLNKQSGEITMQNTNLAAGTIVSFVLTNSTIGANDLLVLQHQSGGTLGAYTLNAACAAGSATIYVRNNTAGGLAEALVLRFAVIKGAVA